MSHRVSPVVSFHSYNPYEALYPGLRVVPRQILHLIKVFREKGYSVIVEPENGTKQSYLAEKGIREFLSDPIYALVVGTSLSLVTNLISSWLYERLKRKPQGDDLNLILEFDENGTKARYSHNGQPISDDRFQSLLDALNQRANQYAEARKIVAPDPMRPFPIHLEHTGKIVGWAQNVFPDDKTKRLMVEGGRITDDETWDRIESGDLKGFSIGGIVTDSRCLVCNREYVDCNHIAGEQYDGKECIVQITGILLAEISIVKEPVQPAAVIKTGSDSPRVQK